MVYEKGSPSSLPGLWKYPSFRNESLISGQLWLKGKQEDDGAEGLWRVHDELYDFSNWVDKHPGGAMWLQLTKKYGDDLELAYMDTYYFIYDKKYRRLLSGHGRNANFMLEFDTSAYSPAHVCYSPTNNKVVGKFKYECCGEEMYECVGLRAKMYTYKCGGKITKKVKGVKKSSLKRKITFEDYKRVLTQQQVMDLGRWNGWPWVERGKGEMNEATNCACDVIVDGTTAPQPAAVATEPACVHYHNQ